MKVLCVQCTKLNEVPDTAPVGSDGKVRFPCPQCGFVTVITRKAAKSKPAPAPPPPPRPQSSAPSISVPGSVPPPPPTRTAPPEPRRPQKSLADELFDGSEKAVGDWMLRRLDGTEVGPITFDALKVMIREGDIGKIDEVRRWDERYVPAAFHEATAELFNELDMASVAPPRKPG